MEELRPSITKWNLDCDDRLLRALQSFSDKIMEKSQQLEDELETLSEQTRFSQLNLANTFNKFLMLSSGQFIESRVIRDNVAEKKPEEKIDSSLAVKNQEIKATEIIERYKQSLTLGMRAMEYTIPQSTLSNAIKTQQDLLEAGVALNLPTCKNDVFNNQPLPYIIGTPEFQQHEDIGLYGAFEDAVFYGMDEKEEKKENEIENKEEVDEKNNIENGEEEEEEDFDFTWIKTHISSLLPKLEKYAEPNHQPLNRTAIKTFFPTASDEQISDIFEYFAEEDEDENKANNPNSVITVAQLISLFKEQKEQPPSSSLIITTKLIENKSTESSDDEDNNEEQKKPVEIKQPANANPGLSSDEEEDGGFFAVSNKKTNLTDFGLEDDAIEKDINNIGSKKVEDKENEDNEINDNQHNEANEDEQKNIVIDPTKLKPGAKPPSMSNRQNTSDVLDANDTDEDLFGPKGKKKQDTNNEKNKKGKAIFDSDEENENSLFNSISIKPNNNNQETLPTPHSTTGKNLENKPKNKGFFGDSDDDNIVEPNEEQIASTKHPHLMATENKNENTKEENKNKSKIDPHALLPHSGMTIRDIKRAKGQDAVSEDGNNNDSQLASQEEKEITEKPLFEDKTKTKNKKPVSDDPLSSLWSDDETGEIFISTTSKKANSNKVENTSTETKKRADQSWEDEDNSLFGSSSNNNATSSKKPKPKPNDIWNEEESDVFNNNKPSKIQEKEETPLQQPLTQKDNVVKEKLGETSKFGITLDVSKMKPQNNPLTVKQIKDSMNNDNQSKAASTPTPTPKPPIPSKIDDIFNDNENNSNIKTKQTKKNTNSLWEDEDDPLFGSTSSNNATSSKKPKSNDLWNEEESEVFSDNKPSKIEEKEKTPLQQPLAQKENVVKEKPGEMSKIGIKFDVSKLKPQNNPLTVKQIKDNINNDNQERTPKPPTSSLPAKTDDIFDDNENNSNTNVKTSQTKSNSNLHWEDEDNSLFGLTSNNDTTSRSNPKSNNLWNDAEENPLFSDSQPSNIEDKEKTQLQQPQQSSAQKENAVKEKPGEMSKIGIKFDVSKLKPQNNPLTVKQIKDNMSNEKVSTPIQTPNVAPTNSKKELSIVEDNETDLFGDTDTKNKKIASNNDEKEESVVSSDSTAKPSAISQATSIFNDELSKITKPKTKRNNRNLGLWDDDDFDDILSKVTSPKSVPATTSISSATVDKKKDDTETNEKKNTDSLKTNVTEKQNTKATQEGLSSLFGDDEVLQPKRKTKVKSGLFDEPETIITKEKSSNINTVTDVNKNSNSANHSSNNNNDNSNPPTQTQEPNATKKIKLNPGFVIDVKALRPGAQPPKKIQSQSNELDSSITLKKPTLIQSRRKKTKKLVDMGDDENETVNVNENMKMNMNANIDVNENSNQNEIENNQNKIEDITITEKNDVAKKDRKDTISDLFEDDDVGNTKNNQKSQSQSKQEIKEENKSMYKTKNEIVFDDPLTSLWSDNEEIKHSFQADVVLKKDNVKKDTNSNNIDINDSNHVSKQQAQKSDNNTILNDLPESDDTHNKNKSNPLFDSDHENNSENDVNYNNNINNQSSNDKENDNQVDNTTTENQETQNNQENNVFDENTNHNNDINDDNFANIVGNDQTKKENETSKQIQDDTNVVQKTQILLDEKNNNFLFEDENTTQNTHKNTSNENPMQQIEDNIHVIPSTKEENDDLDNLFADDHENEKHNDIGSNHINNVDTKIETFDEDNGDSRNFDKETETINENKHDNKSNNNTKNEHENEHENENENENENNMDNQEDNVDAQMQNEDNKNIEINPDEIPIKKGSDADDNNALFLLDDETTQDKNKTHDSDEDDNENNNNNNNDNYNKKLLEGFKNNKTTDDDEFGVDYIMKQDDENKEHNTINKSNESENVETNITTIEDNNNLNDIDTTNVNTKKEQEMQEDLMIPQEKVQEYVNENIIENDNVKDELIAVHDNDVGNIGNKNDDAENDNIDNVQSNDSNHNENDDNVKIDENNNDIEHSKNESNEKSENIDNVQRNDDNRNVNDNNITSEENKDNGNIEMNNDIEPDKIESNENNGIITNEKNDDISNKTNFTTNEKKNGIERNEDEENISDKSSKIIDPFDDFSNNYKKKVSTIEAEGNIDNLFDDEEDSKKYKFQRTYTKHENDNDKEKEKEKEKEKNKDESAFFDPLSENLIHTDENPLEETQTNDISGNMFDDYGNKDDKNRETMLNQLQEEKKQTIQQRQQQDTNFDKLFD